MWVKLDDHFPDNSKVKGLHDKSFRLYVYGLCFAGRTLTDGWLTHTDVKVLCVQVAATKRHVDELAHRGLWVRALDGYCIKDFLDYNPTKEKVVQDREDAKQRMRELRASRSTERSDEQKGEHSAERSIARSTTPTRTRVNQNPSDELAIKMAEIGRMVS